MGMRQTDTFYFNDLISGLHSQEYPVTSRLVYKNAVSLLFEFQRLDYCQGRVARSCGAWGTTGPATTPATVAQSTSTHFYIISLMFGKPDFFFLHLNIQSMLI